MMNDSKRGKYENPDGSATWEYIGVFSCAGLIFCCGCVTGWNSPTLGKFRSPDSPVSLKSSEASTLTSMMSLGIAVAPLLTIPIASTFGRKKSLLVGGIPLIISWLMIATSKHIMVLFAARFIAGLAFGLNLCMSTMYLGEIASVNMRGKIATVCGMMMNTGKLLMFAIVPFLSVTMTACICASIVTLATISAWVIPESPYFLAMVGKFDEAESALEKLRGKTNVAEELELIKTTVSRRVNVKVDLELREKGEDEVAPRRPSALKQLFTVSGNRKALGIIFLFAIAIDLGGFMIIAIYSDIIFAKMKTGVGAHVCTIIIGVIQLASYVLVSFVIEKVGRKPLIFVSGIVSGFCVLTVSVYFYLIEYTEVDVTPYRLFALFVMFLNMSALSIGLMPLLMVIQSEILSTEVKALAMTFAGVGSGLINTIGVKSYLMVAETWGYGHCVPFLYFAGITWTCTFLILELLPETKGKTLLDIQRDLNA